MFPSKAERAERILSRYRPIAPKPLPLPPSGSFGTTDPSSTCASVDSFTSSAKCKKSRKRKADDLASAKALKAPKSIGSGPSNTGGASSLTQGASDGTVPLRDLRSVSQISHGSMAFGVEDFGEMSNGTTRDVRVMPGDARFASYGSVAAPLYVSDAGNMLRQHGVYMSTDVNSQQQHALSLLHQKLSPGYNCSGDGLIEKDIGFMERAAAASATVLPDRSAPASMCDSVGGKAIGYVGGGFTEMIRGITRLPTVADVQSLMQARVSPSAAGQGSAGGSSTCTRMSPTRSREMQSQKADYFQLPPMSHCLIGKSTSLSEADQVCESDAELTTLSLLPNVPSKMGSPAKVSNRDRPPPVQPILPSGTHSAEPSWHQQASSRLEPLAKGAIRDGSPLAQPPAHGVNHVSDSHWHQQGPSRLEPSAKTAIRDGSPSAQNPIPGVIHVVEPPWHQQASSRLEPSAPLASRSPCMPQVGTQLASGIPLFTLPSKTPTGSMIMPSMNLPTMGMAVSPAMADGAVIDQGSLEQVYGGSTDPVLLVDDSNQVLWFNKSYDKALKSAIERLSGRTKPKGPYIDPLGHPTPLGSFVLPVYGKSCRATLWGFLKKLVIQDSELPLQQQCLPGPPSQLQLCVGESSLRMSPLLHNIDPNSRTSSVVCASNSRLTTVTLESVTEFHMDAPAAVECVEAVEARLGAGGGPAFITDCLDRVRWVNAALKQMLVHVNFENLSARAGPSGNSGADGAMSSPLEASTFVVCCTEKIPRSAWAFSCRVNLEWMKGNRRHSMTVPCDVSRFSCIPRSSEVNWVWQFDMAVRLGLA